MPTTLTGLLLFVVLLLPGFVYLVGNEWHGTERRVSPFRELVSLAAVSITTELGVLIVLAGVWAPTLDASEALPDTGRWWREHAWAIVVWGGIILLLAMLVAWSLTTQTVRRWARIEQSRGAMVSAWWKVFKGWTPEPGEARVQIRLEDHSVITGVLLSFNPLVDDTEDRDLILRAPISIHLKGKDRPQQLPLEVMTISARRIMWIGVTYFETPSGAVRHLSDSSDTSPNEPEPGA